MTNQKFQNQINAIIDQVENLIPEYMENPVDKSIANGNVAICIVDEEDNVYGKIWGTNKVRGRESYRVAWIKSSQVWITGYRTGEFEKKIYCEEISEETYGISKPDFIGWEGGQPVVLKNGTKLSIGFSGFRGISDIEIVDKAILMSGY